MNKYLNKFIEKYFSCDSNEIMQALDLGAGDFSDVDYLKENGWECKGVDIKSGVDLNEIYECGRCFDLVFSNYVIHLLRNKENFFRSAYDNLKDGGYFFINALSDQDENTRSGLNLNNAKRIMEEVGFSILKSEIFEVYDDEPGHNHYHKIVEIYAQKNSSLRRQGGNHVKKRRTSSPGDFVCGRPEFTG